MSPVNTLIMCLLSAEISVVMSRIVPSENYTISMTILYQSRCSDSAKFFEEQLKPAIGDLESRSEAIPMKLQLVPYGKANTTKVGNNITFSCPHGEEECEGNRFHACIMERIEGNYEYGIRMIACMFDRFSLDTPKTHANFCCESYGYREYYKDYPQLDYPPIYYENLQGCAKSSEGKRLMYENGLLTAKWAPYFMPTIIVNGDAGDDEFQNQLKKNLLKVLLEMLHTPTTRDPREIIKLNSTKNGTEKAWKYTWDRNNTGSYVGELSLSSKILTSVVLYIQTFFYPRIF